MSDSQIGKILHEGKTIFDLGDLIAVAGALLLPKIIGKSRFFKGLAPEAQEIVHQKLKQHLPNPFGLGLKDEEIRAALFAKASNMNEERKGIAERYAFIKNTLLPSEASMLGLILAGIPTSVSENTETITKEGERSIKEMKEVLKEFSKEDNRIEFLLWLDDEFKNARQNIATTEQTLGEKLINKKAGQHVAEILRGTGIVSPNRMTEGMRNLWKSLGELISKAEKDPLPFLKKVMVQEKPSTPPRPIPMGPVERLVNCLIVGKKHRAKPYSKAKRCVCGLAILVSIVLIVFISIPS